MSTTALFVIDIQAEFISIADTAIPHAARIHEAGAAIINRARNPSTGRPIIVIVQHSESTDNPNATLIAGTKAWELVFPCQDSAEREMLVQKTTRERSRVCPTRFQGLMRVADVFESNPSLAESLKSQGVQTIVALGLQSDFCVRASCRGAVNAGFHVVLLQGAHSTYDNEMTGQKAEDIERNIEVELKTIGVRVVPWDEFHF